MIKELRRIADISSRGGRVPPPYLYVVFILPGFVFTIVDYHTFNYIPFVLVSITILPLMAAVNLFDDYFDYSRGLDKMNAPNTEYRRHPVFFYGVGKKYLIKGASLLSAIYFLLISLLAVKYGLILLPVAFLGFVMGYGYSGWPIGYKYLGLGVFGLFISALIAGSLVSTATLGQFEWASIQFILPFAILMILILFVGNYRDMDYDKKSNFRTLASLLGKKGSELFVLSIFSAFYLVVVLFSFSGVYPTIILISLVSAPFAYYLSVKWVLVERKRYEQYIGPYIFSILALLILLMLL